MLQHFGRQDLRGNFLLLDPAGRFLVIAHGNQRPRDRQVLQRGRDGCPGFLLPTEQDRHIKARGQCAAEDYGFRIIGRRHNDFARLFPEPLGHDRAGLARAAANPQQLRRAILQRVAEVQSIGRRQHDRSLARGQGEQPIGLSRRWTADGHEQWAGP